MIIDFRQGIVSYDLTTTPFTASGTNVSIVVGNQPIVVSVAQDTSDYSYAETTSQPNCWVVPNTTQPYWLFWDFNTRTFARTFGYTSHQPVIGPTAPTTPSLGQMWYNTSTFRNYEYTTGGWTEVLRVFAANYQPTYPVGLQLISMGDHVPLNPPINTIPDFRGTQIGWNQLSVASGSIVNDYTGLPIRKNDGTFFTTEDDVFAQNAAITALRLESNVYTAVSSDIGTITQYQVVAIQPDGTIQLGSYNDVGTTAIGIALQTILPGGTGAICLEGTLTSSTVWNWAGNVGKLLWISGTPGALQPTDPNIDDPATYPIAAQPVARVLSPFTIMFQQGIGTKGPPGTSGSGGTTVVPATPTTQGVVLLSTDGGLLPTPTNVVISELDPRLTNARVALASSILPATNITVAPDAPSNTTAANVQLALQALGLSKLNLTGGSLTGPLVLSADPTTNYQAATKQYVDNNFLSIEADVVLRTGSTMTGPLILSQNPTQNLQAATKQYVDSVASGLSFQAAAEAASTPADASPGGSLSNIVYAGAPNYTLTNAGNLTPLVLDGVNVIAGQRVLIKDLTTADGVNVSAAQNGIYDVTSVGSTTSAWVLTRDPDTTPPNTIDTGTFVFISAGAQNNNTGWVLATPNPITLDTTNLTFVLFSSIATLTSSAVTNALGYIPVGPFSVSNGTAGISVSGSPVQGGAPSGVVLSLSTELLGLNSLTTLGFVQRTGTGSYVAAPLTSSQVTTALGYTPINNATINTIAPLTGGGSLSGTLTLAITPFSGSAAGAVPTSPGGTTAFLRADGQWAIPPGGSGGGVSSVGIATSTSGLLVTGTNPITAAGVINININTELQGLSQVSTNGYVQRTGAGTYTASAVSLALTGDVLASGTTPSIATTLATQTGVTAGTYGSTSNVPVLTINTKGLVTAVSQTPILIDSILPSQTGNAGDFLTTNGTMSSWASAVTAAAGSNTQIQYNNGGAFGASAGLTWNDSPGNRTLTLGETSDGTTYITTNTNSTGQVNLAIDGGNVTISAGTPTASGSAGNYIEITGGTGNSAGNGFGGDVSIIGGSAPGGGEGGDVSVLGGSSVGSDGGSVYISGGSSTSDFGGNVVIQTTPNSNTNYVDRLLISTFGEWKVNGVTGLTGQRLEANGPGQSPTWVNGQPNDVVFATSGQTVVTLTNVFAQAKFPAGASGSFTITAGGPDPLYNSIYGFLTQDFGNYEFNQTAALGNESGSFDGFTVAGFVIYTPNTVYFGVYNSTAATIPAFTITFTDANNVVWTFESVNANGPVNGGGYTQYSWGPGHNVIFTPGNTYTINYTSGGGAAPRAYVQVFVNGVLQREDNSAGTAYATQGQFYVSAYNQITFFVPLSASDEVTVFQL